MGKAKQADATPTIPFDERAEGAVIGAVLLANEVMFELVDKLDVIDFYAEKHRVIWTAMRELQAAASPIDLATLADRLLANGSLQAAGGAAYLVQLYDGTPAAANAPHYANIVRELRAIRDLQAQARRVLADIDDPMNWRHEDRGQQAQRWQAELLDVLKPMESRARKVGGLQTWGQAVSQFLADLDRAEQGTAGQVVTIPTPWPELSRHVELQVGQLNVLAGRPGTGKSGLAIQWFLHYAERGYRPHYVALEERSRTMVHRAIAQTVGVDLRKLRDVAQGRRQDRATVEEAARAAVKLAELPATIDDSPRPSLAALGSRVRKLHSQGCRVLFVDPFLKLGFGHGKDMREKVDTALDELDWLSQDLGLCTIIVTHLRRPADKATATRPTYNELKESGKWEQDARVILLVHREQGSKDGELIVAKANHDTEGNILSLKYDGPTCTWSPVDGCPPPTGREDGYGVF